MGIIHYARAFIKEKKIVFCSFVLLCFDVLLNMTPNFVFRATCLLVALVGGISTVGAESYYDQLLWQSRDYYGILGVKDWGEERMPREVKKVYRKLAVQFHPDKWKTHEDNADLTKEKAAERFLEISEAYEILRDPTKKKEYDDFIETIPASFRPRYGENRLARSSVWMVILGLLLVLSAIQYVGQTTKYNEFVKSWKTMDNVRRHAREQIRDELNKRAKKKNGKPMNSRDRKDLEAKLIDEWLDEKSKDLKVEGGYKKLVWTDLVIIKFLKLPQTLPLWVFRTCKYANRLRTGNHSMEDRVYWTRTALKLMEGQWNDMEEEERKDLLKRALWVAENKKQYDKEKFAEEMAKNPAKMKQWLRWKKRGGDRENIGLEPEEDVQGEAGDW